MIDVTRFYHETQQAREQFERSGAKEAYLQECVHIAALLAAVEIADVNPRMKDLPARIRDSERAIKKSVAEARHLMTTDHDQDTHHHDVLEEFSGHFRSQQTKDLAGVIDILDALGL